MSLKERSYSVLLVSASESFNGALLPLLSRPSLYFGETGGQCGCGQTGSA